MSEQKVKYSEIFRSIQGEGYRTGHPSLWCRSFLCNLECPGFGQDEPTNPDTYDLPHERIPVKDVDKIEDLPVITKGCDSAYSWASKFEHLQHEESAEQVVTRLDEMLPMPGMWRTSTYSFDMIFTGGEPMLKPTQRGWAAMIDVWEQRVRDTASDYAQDGFMRVPDYIVFETNGTQPFASWLLEALDRYNKTLQQYCGQQLTILLNYSPKLFNVSGEPSKKARKPHKIINNIQMLAKRSINPDFTLKFVLNTTDEAWDELEEFLDEISQAAETEVRRAVWIMPVTSTMEDQARMGRPVADRAISKGYKVAARVQTLLWDNTLGS